MNENHLDTHKHMKNSYLLIAVTITFIFQPGYVFSQVDTVFSNSPVFKGVYFSNIEPQSEPVLFAEGLINPKIHHYHSAPVFSPGLDEMYFSVYLNYKDPQRIFVAKKSNGIWGKPELAQFSGQYQDGRPILSPDGNTLFYYSRRPEIEGDSARRESRIWFVKRTEDGWSKPNLLKFDQSLGLGFYPEHFSNDGTFYFAIKVAARDYDIYQCSIEKDMPLDVKRLSEPISIVGKIENGAVTNPDNTILIFQAYDRNDKKELKLMACRKMENGEWSDPVPLSDKINQDQTRFASFSRDGKYFFFTSYKSGVEEIYWVEAKYLFVN